MERKAKLTYESPEIEIIYLNSEDIIITSNEWGEGSSSTGDINSIEPSGLPGTWI